MGYVDHALRDYQSRMGHLVQADAWYQYQLEMLRTMLTRMQIVLEDEGVPEEMIRSVIRCLIYGSPDPSEAIIRQNYEQQAKDLLQHVGLTRV
jgi:hypothetical protein